MRNTQNAEEHSGKQRALLLPRPITFNTFTSFKTLTKLFFQHSVSKQQSSAGHQDGGKRRAHKATTTEQQGIAQDLLSLRLYKSSALIKALGTPAGGTEVKQSCPAQVAVLCDGAWNKQNCWRSSHGLQQQSSIPKQPAVLSAQPRPASCTANGDEPE